MKLSNINKIVVINLKYIMNFKKASMLDTIKEKEFKMLEFSEYDTLNNEYDEN